MSDFFSPMRVDDETFKRALDALARGFDRQAATLMISSYPASFRRWPLIFDIRKADIAKEEWTRFEPVVEWLDHLLFFAFESELDEDAVRDWVSSWVEEPSERARFEELAVTRVELVRRKLPRLGRIWDRKTHSPVPVLLEPWYEVIPETGEVMVALSSSTIGHGLPEKPDRLTLRLLESDLAYLRHVVDRVMEELVTKRDPATKKGVDSHGSSSNA